MEVYDLIQILTRYPAYTKVRFRLGVSMSLTDTERECGEIEFNDFLRLEEVRDSSEDEPIFELTY